MSSAKVGRQPTADLASSEGKAHRPVISWNDAIRTWARIAVLSFGGPAGQISVMHRILVEEKGWIGEARFLHALNYCMLLPGPEAHQLAVYIGWLTHRTVGGIVAGTLFVLPGLVTLGILSWAFSAYGTVGPVAALFFGMKAAVLAVVLEAVFRIGKRALKSRAQIAVAAAAFAAIFLFGTPFPVVIIFAAIIGLAGKRFAPDWFKASGHGGAANTRMEGLVDRQFADGMPDHVRPSTVRFAKVLAIGLLVWFGPPFVLAASVGFGSVYTAIAIFNSKMAVVTFGGAYAVLAYMAQQAVEHFHWLKAGEMLVGLGFAETTPGPLISVVQFVGYMAAFRQPGPLSPVMAGTLGGLVAMWSTFVPSFVWIFLGGPYIEALLGNQALKSALSAVTAAVVGVVLNLAVWFALHTLFAQVLAIRFGLIALSLPVWSSVNWAAAAISVAAMFATLRFRAGMLEVLAASCAAGLCLYYLHMAQ